MRELGISATNDKQILTIDLGLQSYTKIIEISLSDDQKVKPKRSAQWFRTNFRQEGTLRILFSEEEFFEIDSVCNYQNEGVWARNHAGADEKDDIMQKQKFAKRK